MLADNCEKVIVKSVQRKYYKTVMNIEIGQVEEILYKENQKSIGFINEEDDEKNNKDFMIPIKAKADKEKANANENKLMIIE